METITNDFFCNSHSWALEQCLSDPCVGPTTITEQMGKKVFFCLFVELAFGRVSVGGGAASVNTAVLPGALRRRAAENLQSLFF